jgi:hypothetical protein
MSDAPQRVCGDCTLCCKVMAIETLAKPPNVWCADCRPGHGCMRYAERPAECHDFNCLWLIHADIPEHWKPSRSKMVLTTSEDGIEIRCDHASPAGWRKDPYAADIRAWAASGQMNDVTVLVIAGQRMTLVTATSEFDLGIVRADERIVREVEGSLVVGVAVVKAEKSRTR